MGTPERVNTLLARARDALIMIGDAASGDGPWTRLLDMLRDDGRVYGGFPARCELHPERQRLLRCPRDFDEYAPEGGCAEPW